MRKIISAFLILFFSSTLIAQKIFIKNVQYVDVVGSTVKDGDIFIKDGKIISLTKKESPSKDATIIDGSGKFLIPGLIDSHIHLFQSGGLYTRPDVIDLRHVKPYEEERQWLVENMKNILERYLKCGITSVIDVGGPMYNLSLHQTINESSTHPNLFITGPLISTYQPPEFDVVDPPIVKVNSSEEAIALVKKQLPLKPDFIKIWYIVLPTQSAESTYDIVKATIEESHKNGLKVAVHATQLNTAKLAIKAGADILVHSVDEPVDADFLTLLKTNEVSYIPTLVVHGNYSKVLGQEYESSAEDLLYSPPIPLGSLYDVRHLDDPVLAKMKEFAPQFKARIESQDSIRQQNLKILFDENINVATGTDAGNIGTLHVSSYFHELEDMKKSGLTNMEILKASTYNAAKVLAKENEMGHIAVDMNADLVLLNSNPIEHLDALQNIDCIIKNGVLHYPGELANSSPTQLVQEQLNAYNAGNIDAFLIPYQDQVGLYRFPDKLLSKGKKAFRPEYQKMFKDNPNLHCELVNRTVLGKTVIDTEKITGLQNVKEINAIAIYQIERGKIDKVYFVYKQ